MEGYNASICIQTYEETERDVAVAFSFELLSTFSSKPFYNKNKSFTLNIYTHRIQRLLCQHERCDSVGYEPSLFSISSR